MHEQDSAGTLSVEQILNRIRVKRSLNRRNFLASLGMAGAATAGGVLLAGCGGSKSSTVSAAGPSETLMC